MFSLYFCLSVKCCFSIVYLVAPSIDPELMNQLHNEGDTASFVCQAGGEPLPTISWYFNSVQLNQINTSKYMFAHRQFEISVMNTLTIMSVHSSDVGTYTCNATNVVSTDNSSGVLTING